MNLHHIAYAVITILKAESQQWFHYSDTIIQIATENNRNATAAVESLVGTPLDQTFFVFSTLIRKLGGFFIRRKMEETEDGKKDILYRSLLQAVSPKSLFVFEHHS